MNACVHFVSYVQSFVSFKSVVDMCSRAIHFDSRRLKTNLNENKSTLQLRPTTFTIRFAGHSTQNVLQIKCAVFPSFATASLAQMLHFAFF